MDTSVDDYSEVMRDMCPNEERSYYGGGMPERDLLLRAVTLSMVFLEGPGCQRHCPHISYISGHEERCPCGVQLQL